MICRGCENDIADAALFCPLCGADPLLAEPWHETLGLEDGADGPELPSGDLGEYSLEELTTPLLWTAYSLHAFEAVGARLVAELGQLGEAERDSRSEELRATIRDLAARAEFQAGCFSWLAAEVLARYAEEMSREEFFERQPQLAWATLTEYACYVDLHSPAEATDVYSRRVRQHLARVGCVEGASWAPDDEEYRVAYNGLLLAPFPGDGAASMPGMDNINSGPDCIEGILQVALTPALWRYWADMALAPAALVLVYEQANPLGTPAWDDDGPTASLREAARWQAERLAKRHSVEVAAETLQFAGLPAAKCDFRYPWGEWQLVERHVWAYAPGRVYFLRALAPAAWPEYVEAVQGALASFALGTEE